MLITIYYDKDTVKFDKSTFGVQTKITSFFEDKDDKSLVIPYLLEQNNIGYYVEIEVKPNGARTFSVTIDFYNKVNENFINHKAVYENICRFLKDHSNIVSLFLDMEYEVFCFKGIDKYIPYNIAARKLIPLTLPNVRKALGDLRDNTAEYLILAFGDTIKIIDTWNSYQLVYILTKSFIENKFPLINKKRMNESSIISFDGFYLTYIYISHIVGSKVQYKETIKRGYDNISKMNMLAHIPQKSWAIEENYKNIKMERLKNLIKNEKKSIMKKIKDAISDKDAEEVIVSEYIPEYFSHLFSDKSVVMSWTEFVEMYSSSAVINKRFVADLPDSEDSIVIVPDQDLGNQNFHISQDDILFIGLNDNTIYFALKSHSGKPKCTPEENLLAQMLDDYIFTAFGLETQAQYDDDDDNTTPILLDAGG